MQPQMVQSNGSSLKIQPDSPKVWHDVLPRMIPLIYRMLTRKGIHPALAEELTQKSIFDAIDRRQTYDPAKGTLEQWIFTIARNNLSLEMRQRQNLPKRDGQLLKYIEAMDSEPLPDSVLERNETKMLINQALSRLGPIEQAVLRYKYMEDHSARQISKILKISEKAVHSLLYRARISLRDKLIQLAPQFREEHTL